MRQKRKLGVPALAGAALLFTAAAGHAQTIGERVETLEKKVEEQRASLASAIGIDVHAMVDTQYLYSFNDPDTKSVQFRVFDPDHNDIDLNQFNLRFSREKEDEPVGFVANLDFGKVAKVVGSVTCWGGGCNPVPNTSENDDSFELREAFLYYKLPWDGIKVKAGKFVTLLGYEIIPNYNGLNPNISEDMLFGFAIPFTHTGLMTNVPVGDYLSFDLGVVNGWDTVADNNDGKTFLGGMAINPMKQLSFYLSGTYGAEQPNNGHSKRGVFTAVTTVKPTDTMTFVLDVDYGNENDISPANNGTLPTRTAEWYGAALYGLFQITDDLAFNLRGEWFDDMDGTRTGFIAPGGEPGVQAWEITPTIAYKVTTGLLARVEYRHDQANKPFYSKGGKFQDGSDTMSVELNYAF